MSKMHEILLSKFPEATQKDLDTFSKNVRQVESSGGTNLVNPDSSARGDFQFLTKGDGNSFQTALNRLSNTYSSAGHKEPDWVDRARRSNNPMDLPYEQQEELMLANIYQQKGSDDLLSKAFTGDRDASLEAYYKYHHTDPDAATIAAAESAFTTDSSPQVAEVPMKDRQYNLETVSAGVPSLPSITTTARTEADNMSTTDKSSGFGSQWLASLMGVDPTMKVSDYFKGELKEPNLNPNNVQRFPAAGQRPIPLQQTASQVVPLQGTMPYDLNQLKVQSNPTADDMVSAQPKTTPHASEFSQSYVIPKTTPHAPEFSQSYVIPNTGPLAEELLAGAGSYVIPNTGPLAEELLAGAGSYVAPMGREPAAIPLSERGPNPNAVYPLQSGTVVDQNGAPVRSGNRSVIGLPTQNPVYSAPAGGKGANATPQSAIDQLTGIKGFGGK